MKLFDRNKGFLGIDIGTDSVKIVELKKEDGQPTLVTYGVAEDSIDIVRDTSYESTTKIVAVINNAVERARISSRTTIAALPTFSVFSSILSLPSMPSKDLAQAVRWEAKKFVPMPLEEMILDWKLLKTLEELQQERGTSSLSDRADSAASAADNSSADSSATEKTSNQSSVPDPTKPISQLDKDSEQKPVQSKFKKSAYLRVLITAAPKALVSRYVEIFKQCGLVLGSLETEAFALARSLIGKQRGSVMIVDIGSITTDIVIIEDGIPILNRSIDVGGKTLTNSIAQSLHIDVSRAEQFKRDIGIGPDSGSAIPRVMEQTMQPILQEINYSHNLYISQTNQPVEKIVLTGGSALLPAMDVYLARVTNINTYLGDPWSRLRYPEELRPVLEEVGVRLPVAIGLALKPIDKN